MGISRKWWGWGDAAIRMSLEHHKPLWNLLRERLTPHEDARLPIPDPDTITLPPSRLTNADREALARIVGPENVGEDRADRLLHAAGRAYTDLVRLRRGLRLTGPDAVVRPGDTAQVARLIALAVERSMAIVPFGGGSSVVGGVEPRAGAGQRAVLTLDLERLARPPEVESLSRTAWVDAGLFGPALEQSLQPHGLTVGHFPQSFEFSTVGGWVATRSAGQCSTGFGRIDENVLVVDVETPRGRIETAPSVAAAVGPSLRQILIGSEGILGIITRARLRLHARPAHRAATTLFLPTWAGGLEACRRLAQDGPRPTLIRISDAPETEMLLSTVPSPHGLFETLKRRIGTRLLRPHAGQAVLMILAYEGPPREAKAHLAKALHSIRDLIALKAGPGPARTWLADRFRHPYLRDELMSEGVMVETLETGGLYGDLPGLYDAVRHAILGKLAGMGAGGLVMTHVSHLYPEGASLYFSVLAHALPFREIEQWDAVKAAACEAILASRGALSHHHAVGMMHAPFLPAQVGTLGTEILAALKQRLDPTGVLNPDKLVIPGGEHGS